MRRFLQAAIVLPIVFPAFGHSAPIRNTTKEEQASDPARPAEKEIAIDLGNETTLEMVLIPAGEFMMGSPAFAIEAERNERPQHQVRITRPFYLGKYQITQEQWEAVMGSNPSHFRGITNPVENVSWNDCQEFLKKLNSRAAVPHRQFRLPTEAEWEYACRAGTTTRWCFGDDPTQLGEYAWYSENSGKRTQPVGQKQPNAWGLYDMHGNVWEWCSDWFDQGYYRKSPQDDPEGPVDGLVRVIRGGSWDCFAGRCRSANRRMRAPHSRHESLGLRVALTLAE